MCMCAGNDLNVSTVFIGNINSADTVISYQYSGHLRKIGDFIYKACPKVVKNLEIISGNRN